MSGEYAIGQEVAQLFLREAMHNELGDKVQVGARIDIVRDAGGDGSVIDGVRFGDRRRALARCAPVIDGVRTAMDGVAR